MALTKNSAAITQLTASGTSTELDVSASDEHALFIQHSNGAGTPTSQATIQIQARPVGSLAWSDVGGPLGGGLDAAAARTWGDIPLTGVVGAVRIVYVAPGGTTGHTLDAQVGRITAR